MSNPKQIYITDAKTKTKEDFLKIYSYPFLVQYSESNNNEETVKKIAFATISIKSLDDLLKSSPPVKNKELKDIQPIVKTDRNPFASKIVIGRTSAQDIVIDSLNVSKFHAYFEVKDNQYTICDRGSTNGTTLNGKKIEASVPQLIQNRDTVSFGGVTYTFYSSRTAYEIFQGSSDFI